MSRNDRRTVSNGGYSLVEMLVVVSIIGILLGIAAVFGHDALVQSQVEDQTREMFTDLMNARVSALQRNRVYFVTLEANQYSVYEDTNPSPDGDGVLQTAQDNRLVQKTTAYALDSGGSPAAFNFSSCGLASEASYTIRVVSTTAPNFDCIVLNPTRILMGKWNGTDCTLR